jgi:redox-sensitive bicupin YhaK (pirin superfamily)
MLSVRRSQERGHFDHGWLQTYHSFSFGDYQDPHFMGFRDLRVINEDWVQPGKGFGTHPHRDMEILTYVLEGVLEHKDSLGNGSTIRPGELQRMSAGSGVTHSEFNGSQGEPVHLMQIWILPREKGIAPSYEQKPIPPPRKDSPWRLIASPDGVDGSVTVHQDVRVYLAELEADQEVFFQHKPDRHLWLQVTRGKLELGGEALKGGDGVAISEEANISLVARSPAEVLLFDLA